jgi:hypothetical protein
MAFVKDPTSVLEYRFDWNDDDWLAAGEEITESTITAGEGITVDSDTNDASSATVWLSGGTAWERYEVTNRITTDQGRTDERTIRIYVQHR